MFFVFTLAQRVRNSRPKPRRRPRDSPRRITSKIPDTGPRPATGPRQGTALRPATRRLKVTDRRRRPIMARRRPVTRITRLLLPRPQLAPRPNALSPSAARWESGRCTIATPTSTTTLSRPPVRDRIFGAPGLRTGAASAAAGGSGRSVAYDSDFVYDQNIYYLGLQAFLTEKLFLRGGAGIGNISGRDNYGDFLQFGKTGLGLTGTVGIEVLQGYNWSLELAGLLTAGFYSGEKWTSGTVQIGFNFF